MSLRGIDAITFGVEDLGVARRFLTDLGVEARASGDQGASFVTQDGSEVHIRPATAPDLPPAIEPGSTVREVVWGAVDAAALGKMLDRLSAACAVETGADGVARCSDPDGVRLGFRVTRRRVIAAPATPVNAPGAPLRIDQAAPLYDRAIPIGLGHLVMFVNDVAASEAFYVNHLGFHVSDRYPGAAVFLRCQAEGGHHNLFLLERRGRPGINHVAFTVRDIHEVFGGGLAMSRKGWETDIGPGRHPISSAYFWYFRSPCGGSAEYFADEDYLTAAWQPRDFERTPENFVEWAIAGGIDGTTRRQKLR